MQDLINKSDVLLKALPYTQRFRSSTCVVKYGGSFMLPRCFQQDIIGDQVIASRR